MKPLILAGTLIALAPTLAVASEGAQAIAMPADTRLVKFNYDPNNSYTILTRPLSHTNIQLGDGEDLVAMAMGDTAQWMVSNIQGHVFVKPLFPNIATSATLVTNKRTYQLNLRASPQDGTFYQQVTWESPQILTFHNQQLAKVEGFARQAEAKAAPVVTVSDSVALEQVEFQYTIAGEASFKPTHVFDDGRFTWIRMPKIQEMPALFMLNESGEAELLNYTIREPYFIVQRLVPGLLLKLGDQEIRIERDGAIRKKAQSFFPFNLFGN